MYRRSADGGAGAIAAIVLAAATASLVWVCSEGSRTLLYPALYVASLLPGLPLGFALFGRAHGAGWIAGALLGYALTAIALSAAMRAGARSGVAFLAAWAALLVMTLALTRRVRRPLVALPPWTPRDTAALLLVLLLVPALMWAPYARNGAPDATGTRHYRAYFTADFLWHMAMTGELAKLSVPPGNPFAAGQTVNYYWTYFTVPAVGASVLRADGNAIEQCLEINAVLSGLLLMAALFAATWAAAPRPAAVVLAVALAVLAASIQGWYGVYDVQVRGRPLEALRGVNIGALTYWNFRGLRIDALPRALWWTPQHAMACALGLVALVAAAAPGRTAAEGILIVGVSLGAALILSPMLGASFALVYGLAVVLGALWSRLNPLAEAWRHALAAVPVLAAFGWCVFNDMWERAGGALAFGFGGLARRAPLETAVLALGPLLLAALIGLVRPGLRRSSLPHAVAVVAGLVLMYFVRLVPDPAWVGFRAGQILQLTLPGLAVLWIGWTLERRGAARVIGLALLALLFAAGLPTTIVDLHNAQDTANRAMGPGFRWTIDITPEQQAAFAWIRRTTRPDAVVQMEITSRGRETWSLIPSFAERRLAAGEPIALLMDAGNRRRVELVKALYQTADADEAWEIARRLGIDYVYMDRVERQRFPAAAGKFEDAGHRFTPVYRNAEVRIYGVIRNGGPPPANPVAPAGSASN